MKKKPIFVLPVWSLAGPGNRWMKIITMLSKSKPFDFKFMIPKDLYHSISNLDTVDSEEFIKYSTEYIVPIYNYKYKLLNVMEYFIKALFLRVRGYDTIHSIMGIGFSMRLKRFLRYKINYEVVGPVFANNLLGADYNKQIDTIICVSDTIAEQIKSLKNKNTLQKIETYPIPFYNSALHENDTIKKENIVVFAHNFMVKRKNAIMCAFLFHEISKLKPDWEFYFLGKGAEGDNRYEKYISFILSGSNNITFNYFEDISPILQKSKLFISLNSINNYPSQSVLESMHCKNALVITNTGQSDQFIKENGTLVDVEYNAVKKAILELMDDDELLNKGIKSRMLLEERFNPSKFIEKLVELYTS